jgi:copper chaperone
MLRCIRINQTVVRRRALSKTAEKTYQVTGMSCEHCRQSVLEEVSELDGVESAQLELASGRLHVRGDVADEAVEAAVEEAGYAVAESE